METSYKTVYYWDDDDRSLAPFKFREISDDEDVYVPIVPIIQKYWKERQEELYCYAAYSNKHITSEDKNIFNAYDTFISDYDVYYDKYSDYEESYNEPDDQYEESENSEHDEKSESIIDDMVYKSFSYV